MPNGARTVCFSCGNPVGEPPALHRLANGQPCAACRERVLEHLPPALPLGGGVAHALAEHATERGLFDGPQDEGYAGEGPADPGA
jgi:hypothetical protein